MFEVNVVDELVGFVCFVQRGRFNFITRKKLLESAAEGKCSRLWAIFDLDANRMHYLFHASTNPTKRIKLIDYFTKCSLTSTTTKVETKLETWKQKYSGQCISIVWLALHVCKNYTFYVFTFCTFDETSFAISFSKDLPQKCSHSVLP